MLVNTRLAGFSLRSVFATAIFLSLASGPQVHADTFDDAVAAYQNGEKIAAFRLLNQASDEGNAEATFQLAGMLHNGDGVPRNLSKAIALYEQLAEANDPKGLYTLALLHGSGDGLPEDAEHAARLMGKAAEGGLSFAQRAYGQMLIDGRGVEKDLTAAASWMRKAVGQSDTEAQRLYALMLISGSGVDKDMASGLKLMVTAATAGDAEAQCFTGRYFEREGPEKNLETAVKFYRLSAEQRNACGQYKYGLALQNGIAVERDEKTAELLFRAASQQGNFEAKYTLAVLLVDRESSDDTDIQTAKILLIDAGKGGIGRAYLMVASLIAKTEKDAGVVDAYAWALISRASGFVDDQGLTAGLEGYMSAANIEAAKIRSRELVSEHGL